MSGQTESQRVIHEIPPVYDEHSRILILGSFPSVKSREGHFFYNHPQNRLWKVLAVLFGDCRCEKNTCEGTVPSAIEEKKQFLLDHGIAMWDVIASCEIIGSSDSSIRNVVPADIKSIVAHTPIRAVFTNGKTAGRLYKKYQAEHIALQMIELPSTSPANAAFSLERLEEIWKLEIGKYL